MQRSIFFVFGVFCHILFLAIFAYMAGFVGNFAVPKSIDAPAAVGPGSLWIRIAIDLALVALFSIPHTVMARPAFKQRWTRLVPAAIERSLYVLTSCILMIALLVFWQPIPVVLFELKSPTARVMAWGLFAFGWFLVPLATLMINHFDLFGTRQVWLHMKQRAHSDPGFRKPLLYRIVRHPLYVGWITAFWATPTMTVGHLLFAAGFTAYILIAIPFEERDMIARFGDTYRAYRDRVGALIPRLPAIHARANFPVLFDSAWIGWISIIVLLSLHLASNRIEPLIAAMILCIFAAAVDWIGAKEREALGVQVWLGYLLLLLVGVVPGMQWIHVLQLIGAGLRVVTGYCVLRRVLRLLPWNRTEPLSFALAWNLLSAPPGFGGLVCFGDASEQTFDCRCDAAEAA